MEAELIDQTPESGGVGVDLDGDGKVDVTTARVPSTFTDVDGKLGWVGMSIIGVTFASLIYSIVWYRKQMILMEREIEREKTLEKEVSEIKRNLQSVMGRKYKTL